MPDCRYSGCENDPAVERKSVITGQVLGFCEGHDPLEDMALSNLWVKA